MSLPMYASTRKLPSAPYERYTGHLQALINERWENSTQTHFEVYQELVIGSGEYSPVNISIDTAIDIGTGFKKGDDFKVFSHKNIEGQMPLGTMFKTSDDYWLCINTNGYASPTNSCEVRRCNEIMKWVDPSTGCVYQQYCCVDYELSSPRPSKDRDVVVADGHIFIIVQGNDRTRKIRKNQRFIFNGQPYKLSAYQTLLDENSTTDYSNLLYIDMYLDTEQASDDLVTGIANASDYQYLVKIQPDVVEQVTGFNGVVMSSVTLNGEAVNRDVVWEGNDYVTVSSDGSYSLIGEAGTTAVITATLDGNPDVSTSCTINIVEAIDDPTNGIVIQPMFDEVIQNMPQSFSVYNYTNGVQQDDDITCVVSGLSNKYYTLVQNGHDFILSVKDISDTPLTLTFSCDNVTRTMNVLLKPFF